MATWCRWAAPGCRRSSVLVGPQSVTRTLMQVCPCCGSHLTLGQILHSLWLGALINMLQKLSEQIAYCYQRASECRSKAADAVNESASQEYYELERRWLMLARSYELSERITDFTDFLRRRSKIAESLLGWHAISTAPFDRDLELAVLDTDGPHALAFPCRRILHGWVKLETRKMIDVRPTHWREWAG
jgi:hypothetical protein